MMGKFSRYFWSFVYVSFRKGKITLILEREGEAPKVPPPLTQPNTTFLSDVDSLSYNRPGTRAQPDEIDITRIPGCIPLQ